MCNDNQSPADEPVGQLPELNEQPIPMCFAPVYVTYLCGATGITGTCKEILSSCLN